MNTYNVYIPSQQKDVTFQTLTIGQLKEIFTETFKNSFLSTGFNKTVIDIIYSNCKEKIEITNFDKYIIAYQIRFNDISAEYLNQPLKIKHVEHPGTHLIKDGLYEIVCKVPFCSQEKEYIDIIQQLKPDDIDALLLAEISKYIFEINIDSTNINCNVPLHEKILIASNLPVHVLAQIIKYIDTVKSTVDSYYRLSNDVSLPFDLPLLVSQ